MKLNITIINILFLRYLETVTEKWRKRRLEDLKEDLFDPDETELDKKAYEITDELNEKFKQNDKDKRTVQSVIDVSFFRILKAFLRNFMIRIFERTSSEISLNL